MKQERHVRFKGVQTSIQYELDSQQQCIGKQCVECREEKSIEQFGYLKGSFLNKSNQCNSCIAVNAMNYRRSKGIPAKQPTVEFEEGVTKRPCSRCKLVKSLEDFDTNSSGYLGHDSDCSECKRRRGELYRRGKGIKAPRTVSILTNDSGDPTHRECSRCKNMLPLEQFNKHRLAYLGIHPYCKECSSARHLMGKYGMTPEDKSYLYLMQKECCATCLEFVELEKIHVDHCHKTGRVRGLLCSSCNKALGLVKDDPLTCQNMMNYLQANAVADKHSK
jgi:hypothetical protein